MTNGFVSLVGAGPGHPDYLTVKGARVLAQAEVIVYDALISEEFRTLFPVGAEIRFVGKRCGKHSTSQEEICALLVNGAQQGKRVVRLKGGDPGLFSRGGEEILALRAAGIPFEIVPGVSSVFAGAAAAFFSPTHRGLSNRLVVFDGVVLMGSRQIERLAAGLIGAGASPEVPIVLVENATLVDEHVAVATLARAAAGELVPRTDGPGIIYVGAAVALAQASAHAAVEAAA
ncbi:MAG: uroporphyrinogen-III C-methyltransferase [Polyangia bacterium]